MSKLLSCLRVSKLLGVGRITKNDTTYHYPQVNVGDLTMTPSQKLIF